MPSLEDLTPDARDELALLARELAENPNTRESFLRLTKKARPNMTIDTIDMKDSLDARFAEYEAKNAALEGRLREKEALEDLESGASLWLRRVKLRLTMMLLRLKKLCSNGALQITKLPLITMNL